MKDFKMSEQLGFLGTINKYNEHSAVMFVNIPALEMDVGVQGR